MNAGEHVKYGGKEGLILAVEQSMFDPDVQCLYVKFDDGFIKQILTNDSLLQRA